MSSSDDGEDTLTQFEELVTQLRSKRGSRLPPHRQREDGDSTLLTDEDSGELLRDLTHTAVWSVSTAKAGNGVDQLLDGSPNTYWQSDGVQPHTLNAQFSAKRKLKEVLLYLNYFTDESYTPAVVSVLAGSNFHDLKVVKSGQEFNNPEGWVRIPLGDEPDDVAMDNDDLEEYDDVQREQRRQLRAERLRRKREERQNVAQRDDSCEDGSCIKAHMLQVVIHCNHQNGRDSHVRMVKVLGPQQQVAVTSSKFTSVEFQKYQTLR